MMKIRFGFMIGFAVGYYFGAMAGKERFHQLNRLLRGAVRSAPAGMAADGAKAVIDLSVEKAKDGVSSKLHHGNGNTQPSGFSAS